MMSSAANHTNAQRRLSGWAARAGRVQTCPAASRIGPRQGCSFTAALSVNSNLELTRLWSCDRATATRAAWKEGVNARVSAWDTAWDSTDRRLPAQDTRRILQRPGPVNPGMDEDRPLNGSNSRRNRVVNRNGELPVDQSGATAVKDRMESQRILSEVAGHFGLRVEDLVSASRKRAISVPRQVAMYLLVHELGLAFTEVGRLLGGRNHKTVTHGVARVSAEIRRNTELRYDVQAIRERCSGGAVPE